jgi:RNA polymerase sigma factor (sigma-70 family)
MPTSEMSEVIQHLHRVALRDGAALTDAQLLDRFVAHRDGDAFAVLVRRHGPMVWGVCRRLLRGHQDSEDAFQATFLVLARKAASIVPREMVANWLYGVAHQTAFKARAVAARRAARERQVAQMPEPAEAERDSWSDLRSVLDEELSRLPERYRVAIVLCDLEGRSRKDAARQLGCPEGTLAGRVTRGRALLARRLARRGLAVPAGALAAAPDAAQASEPASLVCFATRGASLAAGRAADGVIPVAVAALAEGVLRTMLLTRLKIAAAALLLVALACSGVGVLIQAAPAADQPIASAKGARKDKPPAETKKAALEVHALIEEVNLERGTVTARLAKGDLDDVRSLAALIEDFLNRRGTTIVNLPVTKDALLRAKDVQFTGRQGKVNINDLRNKVVLLRLTVDHRGLVVAGIGSGTPTKGSTPGAKQAESEAKKKNQPVAPKGAATKAERPRTIEARLSSVAPAGSAAYKVGISVDRYFPELDDRGLPRTEFVVREGAGGVQVVIDGKPAKMADLVTDIPISIQLSPDRRTITRIEASLRRELERLRKKVQELERRR